MVLIKGQSPKVHLQTLQALYILNIERRFLRQINNLYEMYECVSNIENDAKCLNGWCIVYKCFCLIFIYNFFLFECVYGQWFDILLCFFFIQPKLKRKKNRKKSKNKCSFTKSTSIQLILLNDIIWTAQIYY